MTSTIRSCTTGHIAEPTILPWTEEVATIGSAETTSLGSGNPPSVVDDDTTRGKHNFTVSYDSWVNDTAKNTSLFLNIFKPNEVNTLHDVLPTQVLQTIWHHNISSDISAETNETFTGTQYNDKADLSNSPTNQSRLTSLPSASSTDVESNAPHQTQRPTPSESLLLPPFSPDNNSSDVTNTLVMKSVAVQKTGKTWNSTDATSIEAAVTPVSTVHVATYSSAGISAGDWNKTNYTITTDTNAGAVVHQSNVTVGTSDPSTATKTTFSLCIIAVMFLINCCL